MEPSSPSLSSIITKELVSLKRSRSRNKGTSKVTVFLTLFLFVVSPFLKEPEDRRFFSDVVFCLIQSCFIASAAVILCVGLQSRRRRSKFFACGEMCFHSESLIHDTSNGMVGNFPKRIMYIVTPREYMSAEVSYPLPECTSGAV